MIEPSLENLLSDQGSSMRRLACEIVGDPHVADDLHQEAWLRSRGVVLEGSTAHQWWRTVVRNLGKSLRLSDGARRNRERSTAKSGSAPSAAEELERAEWITRIAREVQALPEASRTVIVMRFWDGLAPREIARRRECPVATVKSQLQRGLTRLRAALSDEEGRPLSGVVALALPASRSALLYPALLMQSPLKLVAVALVLGALGLWGFQRFSGPPAAVEIAGAEEGAEIEPSLDGGAGEDSGIEGEELDAANSLEGNRRSAELDPGGAATSGVRLEGRIVGREGAPLEGAKLIFDAEELGAFGLGHITGADGSFVFEGLFAGRYGIRVEAPGHLPRDLTLDLPQVEAHRMLDLVLEPGRIVVGHVEDEGGLRVSNAEILLLEQPDPMEAVESRVLARSATDGRFQLEGLPAGPCRVGVDAERFMPSLFEVPSGGLDVSEPLIFQLARGSSRSVHIEGRHQAKGLLRVTASPATGSPLANDEFAWTLHTRRSWSVGAEDVVRLEGLASKERHYIQLQEAQLGGKWRNCADVVLSPDSEERVTLRYKSRATLRFEVVDAESRAPVESFRVSTAFGTDDWEPFGVEPFPRSIDGRFERELEPGPPRRVRIEADDYATAFFLLPQIAPGESYTASAVAMDPEAWEPILVRDAQTLSPVAHAELGLRVEPENEAPHTRPISRTDNQGRAKLLPWKLEEALLTVAHPDYCPLTLDLATAPRPLEIDLQLGSTALVLVSDTAGDPVPGLEIACESSDPEGGILASMTSDVEGRILFHGLPGGEHGFTVVSQELLGQRIMMGGAVAQVTLSENLVGEERYTANLVPGTTTPVEITVPARVPLTGRVFEGGAPKAGVGIYVIERPIGLDMVHQYMSLGDPQVTADAGGSFRVPDIESGEATVFLTHPDRAFPYSVPVDLHKDMPELRIDLPTATLSGIVRDSQGQPVENARVHIVIAGPDGSYSQGPRVLSVDSAGIYSMHTGESRGQTFFTDAEGRYRATNVPDDYVLRVRASTPDGVPKLEEIKLGPTDDGTLDFTLDPAGTLTVHLLTEDGTEAVNCMLTLRWQGPGEEQDHSEFLGLETSYTFEGLRPGPWQVEATNFNSEAHAAPRLVEVPEGDAVEATLTLAP